MKAIQAPTCIRAWLEAATHLQSLPKWRDYNIVLEVDSPFELRADEKQVFNLVDKFLVDHQGHSLNTVINTIFPATLYSNYGAAKVLEHYSALMPRIKKHPDVNWGTYAIRMNGERTDAKNRPFTPLQRLIEKMEQELKQAGPKQAAYELSVTDINADFEIPIYDCTLDSKLTRGGPCLSHLSFKLTDDRRVMLTAFYRSHHYIQRALGNLFGLAWLQEFIANRLGIKSGPLVCISSMATLDTEGDWGIADVERLMRQARKSIGIAEPVSNSTAVLQPA